MVVTPLPVCEAHIIIYSQVPVEVPLTLAARTFVIAPKLIVSRTKFGAAGNCARQIIQSAGRAHAGLIIVIFANGVPVGAG